MNLDKLLLSYLDNYSMLTECNVYHTEYVEVKIIPVLVTQPNIWVVHG